MRGVGAVNGAPLVRWSRVKAAEKIWMISKFNGIEQ
uniref:Uncharacterized protein n=1 Tax=Setaria viridis TaxID=4556 RepID=A0A4U6WI27_SETVI|nr:hypothetical protein SEVIR_1G348950v2 [Setaria viridis]